MGALNQITVSGVPLRDYLAKAEAAERHVEAENLRREEIRDKTFYRPIVTRKILLWMPEKKRERVDPRVMEAAVGRIAVALKEAGKGGLTYEQLRKAAKTTLPDAVLGRIVSELGGHRFRTRYQGPVVVGLVLPMGRKPAAGYHHKKKLALEKQAIVGAPTLTTPIKPIAAINLRIELIALAALQMDSLEKQIGVLKAFKARLEEAGSP